ncbi:hypothetical protein [Undibacterium flavidum]|uniref:Uncharacterized protein n=1 Tax=Undibacterium flavidum TaxID=2762297 RepID=A0ABR6YHN0_9BURK|nr:hypothetical protein [Undibacterium flavidum]MBC3876038.1 hypothetical protein [Undibacterium flavidum]
MSKKSMRKYLKYSILCLSLTPCFWFVISFAIYRIPYPKSNLIFTGNVQYKFVELELSNRGFLESLLGNAPIRIDGAPLLYIAASEKEKLWSVSPWELQKKGYTLRATLETQTLLFGEFGVASVVHIVPVNESPQIRK